MSEDDIFARTKLLLGAEGAVVLQKCFVAVVGLGGVGSYVVEGLARAGVGHLLLVDGDNVCLTDFNRQIQAIRPNLGKKKSTALAERVHDINPNIQVEQISEFYSRNTAEKFWARRYDYVVDAVDSVSVKINLAIECERRAIPLIACMGTGNKLDPTKFAVADIFQTSVDPLARIMRRKLQACGVRRLKVVYSKEQPIASESKTIGSVSFVPSVAGLIIAGEVVKDLRKR